jgi:hypothetical protein
MDAYAKQKKSKDERKFCFNVFALQLWLQTKDWTYELSQKFDANPTVHY